MFQLRFPTAAETQHDDDKLAYTQPPQHPTIVLRSRSNTNIGENATTNATATAKNQGNKASTHNSTLGGDVALPAHTAVQHAVSDVGLSHSGFRCHST